MLLIKYNLYRPTSLYNKAKLHTAMEKSVIHFYYPLAIKKNNGMRN